MFAFSKAAVLNSLVQGGQQYWTFPFSKGSLVEVIDRDTHILVYYFTELITTVKKFYETGFWTKRKAEPAKNGIVLNENKKLVMAWLSFAFPHSAKGNIPFNTNFSPYNR